MLAICISIVQWNNHEQTLACIQSLENMFVPADVKIEIIIVDNDSAQANKINIDSSKFPLKFIQSDDNLGFAGGHRLSTYWMRDKDFDLLWLLNPDAIVSETALTGILQAYQTHGEAIYGSILQNFDGSGRMKMQIFAVDERGKLLPNEQVVRADSIFQDVFKDFAPVRVANVSGASMIIPSSIIQRCGFMDETFFMYGEEVDYCYRLLKAGIAIYIVPSSIVFHEIHGTAKVNLRVNDMLNYYRIRNKLIYIRQHFGFWIYIQTLFKHLTSGACLKWLLKCLIFFYRPYTNEGCVFYYLGIRDAILHRRGRPYNPNDYLDVVVNESV